jgi:putative MATE family efflux protein
MQAAEIYFLLTALSYPFLALYNAAASLYRAVGNSKITMIIAIVMNILNLAGNAVFIFVCKWGVMGAGLATLISRVVAAVILVSLLIRSRSRSISLGGIFNIQINMTMIRGILNVGVPSALESSMFQIGKILVSRIFTTFGTAAIAANAISGVINSFSFMPANAFAMAMLTIVGQCVGAGDYREARRNTAKLMKLTYVSVFILSLITFIFLNPLIGIFRLSEEARQIARQFLIIHIVMAPISWSASFTLPNALRAAGDARYCMVVATISMWIIRVVFAYLLAYPLGLGPIGVWVAMVSDWCLRAVCYILRWRSGKWQEKKVI